MHLSDKQIERYQHHITLKDIGGEGQKRLLDSKILIVGAGGLGSPAAFYLAAAGIGTIGIIDDDRVELSNLQRQILHSTKDIGKVKVDSAKEKMQALNPEVRVNAHAMRLYQDNINSVIADYDFILDASDNFPTKYLINDVCVVKGRAFSHGGVVGLKGQAFTYVPQSMCYRCIFPEPPPSGIILDCRGVGILGAVAGIIGTIQATEAIKFILKRGSLLTDQMLTFDALAMEFRKIKLNKSNQCPLCGHRRMMT